MFTIVGAAVGILLVVAFFMFGGSIWETVAAVARIAGSWLLAGARMGVNAMLAVSWYFAGVIALIVIAAGTGAYFYWIKPGTLKLAALRPPVCTELVDRKGVVLDYLCPFDGVRVWRRLDGVSQNLRTIVVMLEDDKFYEHAGLDIDGIVNAIETDLERGKLARGGSTITQQLAKNLFLTKEKSILRKATEVPLAIRLENELDKDQILELYLNTIEWGPGIYGVEAASRLYFDHEASQLTNEEAWLLALMIPNPKELNLWIAPRAKKSMLKRARHLATRLYQEHRMSKDESLQTLARFERFIEQWMSMRPVALRTGRKYPARWSHSSGFSITQISSVRRGAAGLLKRIKQKPLRLNIDREVQDKLESVQAAARVHDMADVVAVMEGSQIRAMVPIASADVAEQVRPVAEQLGYSTQVFPARKIPNEALWP